MTDKINDGGPAFPCEQHETLEGTWNQTFDAGMSVRDYFAAAALTGMCSSPLFPEFAAQGDDISKPVCTKAEAVSRHAYVLADAMLSARENQS